MKKERGAITLITLVTLVFMILFLISTFVIIANRRQTQIGYKQQTKEIYDNDVQRVNEIYEEYFADGYFTGENVEIPIYTAEQLLQIATEKDVMIEGKIYNMKKDGKYKLMKDIEFHISDYEEEFPDIFEDVVENGVTIKRWTGLDAISLEENGSIELSEFVITEIYTNSENKDVNKVYPEIPINSIEQVFKIATGEIVEIEGEQYKFDANREYKLMEDIEFKVSEYSTSYPDEFKDEGIVNKIKRWKGVSEISFTENGKFDFNGKTITEIYTNNSGQEETQEYK